MMVTYLICYSGFLHEYKPTKLFKKAHTKKEFLEASLLSNNKRMLSPCLQYHLTAGNRAFENLFKESTPEYNMGLRHCPSEETIHFAASTG